MSKANFKNLLHSAIIHRENDLNAMLKKCRAYQDTEEKISALQSELNQRLLGIHLQTAKELIRIAEFRLKLEREHMYILGLRDGITAIHWGDAHLDGVLSYQFKSGIPPYDL